MRNVNIKIVTVVKWLAYSFCVGFFVLGGMIFLREIYNCRNFGGSMELIACESGQLVSSSFLGALNITFLSMPIIFFAILAFLLGLGWEVRKFDYLQDDNTNTS